MTPEISDPVIACTLGAGDFKARVAWIADLNATALREHQRDDLVLSLVYAPEARDQVRQLVAQEQACCAFLAFELREDADASRLTITAPEAAREAAEMVLEPFISGKPVASAGWGCCAHPVESSLSVEPGRESSVCR